MKKIEAIVRPEKLEEVKAALAKIEVKGITVSEVIGTGTQKSLKEKVRGSLVVVNFRSHIKFEIIVSTDEWADKTIAAIKDAAFTGKKGDGKILAYNLESVTRIRTGETGYDAIN